MKTSEKTSELTKAMSNFQGQLTTLAKDTKAFKYKYTTLASIWESFRPLLSELGLFIFQDVVTTEQGVKVATRINHISDQWIETDYILIPMGKRDAHSTGSAASYGRRYSLSAALGIVTEEDDDGNAAQKAAPKPKIDVNAWIDKWKDDFDRTEIMEFLEYRSNLFGVKGVETVEELSKNEEGFRKEIAAWIAKKEANDLNKD